MYLTYISSSGIAEGPCHWNPVLRRGSCTMWTPPREEIKLWSQHGGRPLGNSGGPLLWRARTLSCPNWPQLTATVAPTSACVPASQAWPLWQFGSPTVLSLWLSWMEADTYTHARAPHHTALWGDATVICKQDQTQLPSWTLILNGTKNQLLGKEETFTWTQISVWEKWNFI